MTLPSWGPMSPSFLLALFLNVILASIPLSVVTADEYLKQPSDSTSAVKRSVSGAQKSPRLLELIKMRDTVSNMIPVDSTSLTEHAADGTGDLAEGDSNTSQLTKRVFCNGFTGCGGRFRGRRRHFNEALKKRRLVRQRVAKRPFCNQLGCYNGGRKREEESMEPVDQLNVLVPTSSRVPILVPVASPGLDEKMKRLFCNGYGGCQNGGKRQTALSGRELGGETVLSGQVARPLSEESLQKLSKVKRFFAGGYDSDMQKLIDSLKR